MTWAWVRPADPTVLAGRPLLDLGTGDGQTLARLVRGRGLSVGVDRSPDALRAARQSGIETLVCAVADALPFREDAFATVVAGDLFHHIDDSALDVVLDEIRSVLGPSGKLVAWWYERPGRPAPDAPRFPREVNGMRDALTGAGFREIRVLELVADLEPIPPTVGVVAEL